MNQSVEERFATSESERGLPSLIKQLADQIAHLLGTEVNLAKAELREATSEFKAGAISLGSGALVLLAGILGLLASAILALAQVMEPWLSALLVGGVVTLLGIIMVAAGKRKMEPAAFTPERTQEQLRKDKEMAKRAMK